MSKLREFFIAFSLLPYKWTWIALMISYAVLFSWWDEALIWGLGLAWNWIVIPIYYIIEYCVVLPLTLLLAKKTYRKLNIQTPMRQVLVHSLKNSLPAIVYRKLRKRAKG